MSHLATQARVHSGLVYEKKIVGGKIMRSGGDAALFRFVLILNCFLMCLSFWWGPLPGYKAMDFEPKKDGTCIRHYISLFPFFPLNSWGSLLEHYFIVGLIYLFVLQLVGLLRTLCNVYVKSCRPLDQSWLVPNEPRQQAGQTQCLNLGTASSQVL